QACLVQFPSSSLEAQQLSILPRLALFKARAQSTRLQSILWMHLFAHCLSATAMMAIGTRTHATWADRQCDNSIWSMSTCAIGSVCMVSGSLTRHASQINLDYVSRTSAIVKWK